MRSIWLRSLLILAVCSVGSVWAQNSLTLNPDSEERSARSAEQSVCPNHLIPPAVDAAVDSCVDRLFKADVEELAGARLNPAALPAEDPELLGTIEAGKPPARARLSAATSWGAQARGSPETVLPAASATRETITLPVMPTPADAATELTEPADSGSVSALGLKLAHIRGHTPPERARHPSVESQKQRHPQCQRLHLSEAECRTRQREQRVSGLSRRTDQAASYSRQQPIP